MIIFIRVTNAQPLQIIGFPIVNAGLMLLGPLQGFFGGLSAGFSGACGGRSDF
jgi:hypothetical protein